MKFRMKNKFHPFHIVTLRPWPIIRARLAWAITLIATINLNRKFNLLTLIVLISICRRAYFWWKDTTREAILQGFHQYFVTRGLKAGIILFILSEVLFFLSFFWAYFHSSISPTIEIGQEWPPYLVKTFNPINVPLLNTIILIRSGVSVTWSHHAIINNIKKESLISLITTCLLGIYFTILQVIEYIQAEFNISDSAFGSTFFLATGFHGLHVIIGTTFLITSIVRIAIINNPPNHIIGLEIAIWYWHFVDIVWLFLYSSIYWWGN